MITVENDTGTVAQFTDREFEWMMLNARNRIMSAVKSGVCLHFEKALVDKIRSAGIALVLRGFEDVP